MSDMEAKVVKEIEVSLVVIRANGDIEDLGVTDYWHPNPIKRKLFYLRKKLGHRKEANPI